MWMPKLMSEDEARTIYLAQPLASLMERRTQSQQTDAYLGHARVLARRVCCTALERSGIAPSDIGLVIGVSCTGVVLPSLDAELIPVIGLRPEVARLPITELGCGGGVAGLARGLDYLRAYPERTVLLFAVEIPSLTFQPDDRSVDNLVAAMVFADGAGAVVLRGDDGQRGWTLERAGPVLVPEGAQHLGYELRDGGLARVWCPARTRVALLRPKRASDPQPSTVGTASERADLSRDRPRQPRIIHAAAPGAGVASTRAAGFHRRHRVDRGVDGGGAAV